jgi:peptidyl-prolyl cis-trans isomerase SurA
MGNKKHLSLWSVGLLLFGCLTVMASAETLERIVAVVNGDIILYGDVLEQISTIQKGKPSLNLQDPEVKAKLEREVLQTLIRQRLSDQEVKRQKIVAAKSEVDKTIEDIRRENGGLTEEQFELLLSRDGMEMKKFREKLRQELERKKLMERMIRSKIVITESQIDARLQSQPVQSDRPPIMPNPASAPRLSDVQGKRHLAMIFLPVAQGARGDSIAKAEKQAHNIHSRLKGGEDFAKLAKEYSQGPGAADGGDIGFVSADELAPEIEKGIRGMSEGGISEVVKTSAGFYILKILGASKEPAPSPQQPPPSREPSNVREMVRRQLFMEELGRKYEEWIQDVEKKAFIKITL